MQIEAYNLNRPAQTFSVVQTQMGKRFVVQLFIRKFISDMTSCVTSQRTKHPCPFKNNLLVYMQGTLKPTPIIPLL